jgi:hypothetical protein
MTELEVPLSNMLDPAIVDGVVEARAARLGLRATLKGTLARYPGCVHWHFKQRRERGTLEVTWWPQGRRLWLSVQAGRTAVWIEAAAADLKTALEDAEA